MVEDAMGKLNVLIGADIVPTKSNMEKFENNEITYLVGNECLELFSKARYRIFNLEVPLVDEVRPIEKCGPNLIASTKSVNGIKGLNINLLTLANNHILDQDVNGLISTVNVLDHAGINHVGAGLSINEARKPHKFTINNTRYLVYACAEHEFSIAGKSKPGVNPWDLIDSLNDIRRYKEECDYLIVLYHGGKEHYRYPSPNLQKYLRAIVDAGANLVVAQHSHCIGCKEDYNNGTIVYGQGNFLFDDCDNEFWNSSILIGITDTGIEYYPLVKCDDKVRLASIEEKQKIISDFYKRSENIKKEDFIENEYQMFADKLLANYVLTLNGKCNSFIFRVINKLSGYKYQYKYVERYLKKHNRVARYLNMFECEAHNELICKALHKKLKDDN